MRDGRRPCRVLLANSEFHRALSLVCYKMPPEIPDIQALQRSCVSAVRRVCAVVHSVRPAAGANSVDGDGACTP